MTGAVLPGGKGVDEAIVGFLRDALGKRVLDAVLVPMRVPAGDSFAWVLVEDPSLLDGASPLPPIMPLSGARALSAMTRRGGWIRKVGAVLRPCEIEAAVELAKLDQIDLDKITLISIDCPGVLPLSDYLANRDESESKFVQARASWDTDAVRPVCRICHRFTMPPSSDLHFALLGMEKETVGVVPGSSRGEAMLESMGIAAEEPMDPWEAKARELTALRASKRNEEHQRLRHEVGGADNLLSALGECIDCHNCMRVCPVCYCRQCYFDSDALKMTGENYLRRAQKRGSLRAPTDTVLFHLGRMSHMAASCVSCGCCEDACPASVKVGQLFTMVADGVQQALDYVPGASRDEPRPETTYEEEELSHVEQAYVETYQPQRETERV
jgi:formate dehydrogenase subunit beta